MKSVFPDHGVGKEKEFHSTFRTYRAWYRPLDGSLFSCHRHPMAAEESSEFNEGLIAALRFHLGNRKNELCPGRKLDQLLLQSRHRLKLVLDDSRVKPKPRRSIVKEDGKRLISLAASAVPRKRSVSPARPRKFA